MTSGVQTVKNLRIGSGKQGNIKPIQSSHFLDTIMQLMGMSTQVLRVPREALESLTLCGDGQECKLERIIEISNVDEIEIVVDEDLPGGFCHVEGCAAFVIDGTKSDVDVAIKFINYEVRNFQSTNKVGNIDSHRNEPNSGDVDHIENSKADSHIRTEVVQVPCNVRDWVFGKKLISLGATKEEFFLKRVYAVTGGGIAEKGVKVLYGFAPVVLIGEEDNVKRAKNQLEQDVWDNIPKMREFFYSKAYNTSFDVEKKNIDLMLGPNGKTLQKARDILNTRPLIGRIKRESESPRLYTYDIRCSDKNAIVEVKKLLTEFSKDEIEIPKVLADELCNKTLARKMVARVTLEPPGKGPNVKITLEGEYDDVKAAKTFICEELQARRKFGDTKVAKTVFVNRRMKPKYENERAKDKRDEVFEVGAKITPDDVFYTRLGNIIQKHGFESFLNQPLAYAEYICKDNMKVEVILADGVYCEALVVSLISDVVAVSLEGSHCDTQLLIPFDKVLLPRGNPDPKAKFDVGDEVQAKLNFKSEYAICDLWCSGIVKKQSQNDSDLYIIKFIAKPLENLSKRMPSNKLRKNNGSVPLGKNYFSCVGAPVQDLDTEVITQITQPNTHKSYLDSLGAEMFFYDPYCSKIILISKGKLDIQRVVKSSALYFDRLQSLGSKSVNPEQYYSETFHILKNVMPTAIGTKGNNIKKAEKIPGIIKIFVDPNKPTIEIVGENVECVKEARTMLEYRQESFTVPPSSFVGSIIGKDGDIVKNIENASGARVNIAPTTEPSTEPTRITLVGPARSVCHAKILIENLIPSLIISYTRIKDLEKQNKLDLEVEACNIGKVKVIDISEDGKLVVESENGKTHLVSFSEVNFPQFSKFKGPITKDTFYKVDILVDEKIGAACASYSHKNFQIATCASSCVYRKDALVLRLISRTARTKELAEKIEVLHLSNIVINARFRSLTCNSVKDKETGNFERTNFEKEKTNVDQISSYQDESAHTPQIPPQLIPHTPKIPPQLIPHTPKIPPQLIPHTPQIPPQLIPHTPQIPPQLIPHTPKIPPQLIPHTPQIPTKLIPHTPKIPHRLIPHTPQIPPQLIPHTPQIPPQLMPHLNRNGLSETDYVARNENLKLEKPILDYICRIVKVDPNKITDRIWKLSLNVAGVRELIKLGRNEFEIRGNCKESVDRAENILNYVDLSVYQEGSIYGVEKDANISVDFENALRKEFKEWNNYAYSNRNVTIDFWVKLDIDYCTVYAIAHVVGPVRYAQWVKDSMEEYVKQAGRYVIFTDKSDYFRMYRYECLMRSREIANARVVESSGGRLLIRSPDMNNLCTARRIFDVRSDRKLIPEWVAYKLTPSVVNKIKKDTGIFSMDMTGGWVMGKVPVDMVGPASDIEAAKIELRKIEENSSYCWPVRILFFLFFLYSIYVLLLICIRARVEI